jgi:hypothetical protein
MRIAFKIEKAENGEMIAEKSFRIFPLRMFCEKQLVKILSISVAECAVTRGLVL